MPNSVTAAEFTARGTRVIEIPGFFEGDEPLAITVKATSLSKILMSGKIPNSVLAAVKEVFGEMKKVQAQEGDKADAGILEMLANDPQGLQDLQSMLDIVCDACMLKPKFVDVSSVMTDEQKITVFNFVNGGLRKLADFRQDAQVHGDGDSGSSVGMPTLTVIGSNGPS